MHGELEQSSSLSGSGATPLDPGDPRRIGSFTLLGLLGSGGMGRVYLGTASGRYVAVKLVLPALAEDEDFLRHFGHELDNLARLPQGVSARLLASDRVSQPPWFATEYIPGTTLSEALRLHGGPLPGGSLWRLLRDAADGLRAVHAAGIVHRDLKPSNVMLTLDGVTLIDFGVARASDQSRLTKSGMVIGTPAYMAPEQAVAERQLTGAADVFALGGLLARAANGRPPFGTGSGPELLYRIVHTEPDLGELPDTDPGLCAVVESCLAKDPKSRPTAAELLDLAAGHVPSAALPAAATAATAATSSPWPPAVTEQIAERAAFAARPPVIRRPETESGSQPPPGSGPGPEAPTAELTSPRPTAPEPGQAARPAAAAEPDPQPAPARDKSRKRLSRTLFVVIPVVVSTGTALMVTLAPYGSSPQGAAPGASSSPSSGPPSGDLPTPRASAHPSASSSRSAGSSPAPGSAPSSELPRGSGAGDGGTGRSGGAVAADGAAASGGSGGSGTSGDSGATGGSGSGGGQDTAALPTGRHRLKNSSDGQCLADFAYAGVNQPAPSRCGAPATNTGTLSYEWTYSAASGSTFRLVSKASGKCLSATSTNGFPAIQSCDGSSAQVWRIGSTTSGGDTIKNPAGGKCLAMSGANVITRPCDPADTTQLWRNA
ncbi:serine/threonine protein kinase [Streptomyces sp. GC420]|uniref:serine/threonine-protein kinase n=1 Tax=Streptomyces sp. GC420 TaxID=2697568 RepID=UPI0014150D37|nr:serine/threonine protein kinase [Streptomyces sp. GC420]NBM15405.1 protein kinase [Streptomyces sp. GC420]